MSPEVTVALINSIPAILSVILVAVLFYYFRRPIYELIQRIRGLSLFGVELTFYREKELDKANEKQGAKVNPRERSQVLRRAEQVAPIIQGAQILWVDDKPAWNISERKVLRSLGIFVDLARTSTEALSMIPHKDYDAVISNIARDDLGEEKIQEFLTNIQKQDPQLFGSTIFYVGVLHPGVPPNAFGITNRPDELINLVLSLLVRKRS